MSRNRFLITVAAAAVAACSSDQSATAPNRTAGRAQPAPSHVEIAGTIEVSGHDAAPVSLRYDDKLIPLGGAESALLEGLVGAEALVRGTEDLDGVLVVESFRVLAVNGRAALDGVLMIYVASNYAIRLDDGSVYALEDPPAELTEHVGSRVWVTGGTDGLPIEFGVIEYGRSR